MGILFFFVPTLFRGRHEAFSLSKLLRCVVAFRCRISRSDPFVRGAAASAPLRFYFRSLSGLERVPWGVTGTRARIGDNVSLWILAGCYSVDRSTRGVPIDDTAQILTNIDFLHLQLAASRSTTSPSTPPPFRVSVVVTRRPRIQLFVRITCSYERRRLSNTVFLPPI